KIKFTIEVAQLLSRLDNEIERDVYLQEIANDTKISAQSILNEMNKYKAIQRKNTNKINIYSKKIEAQPQNHLKINKESSNIDEKNGLYKAQKNILRFLYNNASFYPKIKPHLSYEDFIDPILKKVAQLIYEQYDK